MGRFYKTKEPVFVDNTIYQAPWELMKTVLDTHEKRTDELFAKTSITENAIDEIKYLNIPEDVKLVKEIQQKYKDKIDDITSSIYENSMNYINHKIAIDNLQKDMLEDMTSGDWYYVQKRYEDYKKWLKDNEEGVDSHTYNLKTQYELDKLRKAVAENKHAQFNAGKIIPRPDLSDKDTLDMFKAIKAKYQEYHSKDGRYIIGDKILTQEEIASIALNELLSRPEYRGYLKQMYDMGFENYLGEDESLPPLYITNEKGETVYNWKHPFANDIAKLAEIFEVYERKVKEDKYGLQRTKYGYNIGLEAIKQRNRIELENLKHKNKKELEGLKTQLEAAALAGDGEAAENLNILTANEIVGELPYPKIDIEDDYAAVENAKKIDPSGNLLPVEKQRLENATNYAKEKFKELYGDYENPIELEYIEWLGDRKHTSETVSEFVKNKYKINNYKELSKILSAERYQVQKKVLDNIPSFNKNSKTNTENILDDPGYTSVYLKDIGEEFENIRKKWYESYSNQDKQIIAEPIKDLDVSRTMITQIKRLPDYFTIVDKQGNSKKDYRKILKNLNNNTPLYVVPSNATGHMGMLVTKNGKDYYIFPKISNQAVTSKMIAHSLMGVDKKGQYYKTMRDWTKIRLVNEFDAVGKNTQGTRPLKTKVYGIDVFLELVPKGTTYKINLREPGKNLEDKPDAVFNSMDDLLNHMKDKFDEVTKEKNKKGNKNKK